MARTEEEAEAEEDKRRVDEEYQKFMEHPPVLDAHIWKTATIECRLDRNMADIEYDLTWMKMNRSSPLAEHLDSQLLISLNERVLPPDRRYKVIRYNQTLWQLKISDLREEDGGGAIYMCRAYVKKKFAHPNYLGLPLYGYARGARLRVLTPPQIVHDESSPQQVLAPEYEPISLRCKVFSLNPNFLTWQREDRQPVAGNSSALHTLGKLPTNKHVGAWLDSSELAFDPFLREHSGAYLVSTTFSF